MSAALILLVLSALIGFGLGTWFRWPAIAASSVAIAVLLVGNSANPEL